MTKGQEIADAWHYDQSYRRALADKIDAAIKEAVQEAIRASHKPKQPVWCEHMRYRDIVEWKEVKFGAHTSSMTFVTADMKFCPICGAKRPEGA